MSKNRSTNFPAVDIGEAVDLAHNIWENAERHLVPAETVVQQYWGYSSKSSGGKQRLGALRSFGLIDAEGSGENRRIRLTEEAAKILAGHVAKDQLIKECALAPRVHRILWEELCSGSGLPPDETLRHYLIFDFEPQFSKSAADRLVAEFRRTMEYAGLADDGGQGIMVGGAESVASAGPVEAERGSESVGEGGLSASTAAVDQAHPARRLSARSSGSGRRQDVFSVDEGEILVEWPYALSEETVADIEEWFKILVKKMRRASGSKSARRDEVEEDNQ